MTTIREVAEHYAALVRKDKDRKVLMVLVTDESGDDGADVEEARQALKRNHIPLYVIGRQSLFGYPYAHHRYEDPVTHDVYHPLIRRGPETADLELYQWDGLYDRWDEQPSGFASYELARLTKESGGIYFVLPSEEFMRVSHREKAYSITQLKEYLPEYDNRLTYVEKRNASPLRQTLHAIVIEGQGLPLPPRLPDRARGSWSRPPWRRGRRPPSSSTSSWRSRTGSKALRKVRDREPEKRWQAHYDLMLAQTVAFEVKAYEYRALMASIVNKPPVPKNAADAGPHDHMGRRSCPGAPGPQERDRQEVRRSQAVARGGHRPPSQDPLGRPGPGCPQPRLLGPVQRVAPQPEVQRTLPVRPQVLIFVIGHQVIGHELKTFGSPRRPDARLEPPMTIDQEMTLIPGLSELWSETTGDPRVIVAVLDGPVDRAHPALAGADLETVEAAVPAVARHGGPATRHGTAVASLIFGRHAPENPVRGMAPGCRGLVVPIFDDADSSGETRADEPFRPVCSQLDLARAILLAVEHGARIINISAGQPLPASAAYPVMADAVDRAVRRGVLVVAAAGNDGCECEHIPAAMPGVLAVGAMDSRGQPIASSNWGSSYRSAGLLAPGTGLLAARAGGGTSVVGGTSFATAIVAGAAALLASLALRRGQSLDGPRIREILLDSALKCFEDTISCRQWLAGRLDLLGSRHLLSIRGLRMSDDVPIHVSSADAGWPGVDTVMGTPSEQRSAPGPCSGIPPPYPVRDGPRLGPGPARDPIGRLRLRELPCQGRTGQAGPAKPRLVFALGQIGYDLISEARRDSIQQHMGGPAANPFDPSQVLGYLGDNPWEAASIIWTLSFDQTPLYAIVPAGPFAAKIYDLLREFLDDQVNGRVEMVSIPGRLAGQARLLNGQVVPVVIPEPRGMYSWTTGALIKAVVGEPPRPRTAPRRARPTTARPRPSASSSRRSTTSCATSG